MALRAVGPLRGREADHRARRVSDAGGDHVADRRAELPRLLQRQDARGIRAHFGLWREQVAAHCLDDEIGQRVAAAGQSARFRPAQLLDAGHQVGALDVGVEHDGGAEFSRQLAPIRDRLDGDDLGGALDASALHRAQAERTAPQHDNIGAGLDARLGHRGRQAHHADVGQHRQLDRRHGTHDRHAVVVESHHQLRASGSEAGDLRAVAHLGDRQVGIAVGVAAQAVIGAAAQAVVAGAALRLAGDDHALADFHALHAGTHFDHRYRRHRGRG